jgi:hypothetical protein
MKTLLYQETSKGAKVLVGIGEASIDPLETRKNGVEHAKESPKYSELKARIKTYNDYLERCKADGITFHDSDAVPPRVKAELRNRLLVVASLQDELMEIKRNYEEENPVYMIPASTLLVGDEDAENIALAEPGDKLIVLRQGKGGKYAGYDMIENNTGKKYRMPNTRQWLYLNEPDEDMPTGAILTDPDEVELRAIEKARIMALPAGERESLKAGHIKGAKHEYSLESIAAAELEGDPEAAERAKADARAQYDARLKDIEALFS